MLLSLQINLLRHIFFNAKRTVFVRSIHAEKKVASFIERNEFLFKKDKNAIVTNHRFTFAEVFNNNRKTFIKRKILRP